MAVNMIPDYFGSYIGGARRDDWKEDWLCPSNLDEMNTAEIRKLVNRDSVWPLPDALKAVENGADPFLVYWKRIIRRTAYKSPYIEKNEDVREKAKLYIEQLRCLRDLTEEVTDEKKIHVFYYKCSVTDLSACISSYALKSTHRGLSRYRDSCARSGFPYVKRKQPTNKKAAFVPPQLEQIEREGKDYRNGVLVTPEAWQETYAFRGVEFGNWTSQKDRQFSLDYAFDALKDLGYALGVEDTDLAFDGKLALAFGSRGRSSASAHFEPMRQVINLTKMHGAGCTAHEWFHALDYFLARKYGVDDTQLASESKQQDGLPESFRRLILALKQDADGNKTDYLRGSLRWDRNFRKDGFGYWSSNCEMAARAFACYVKDVLGYKSDYLIAHADVYVFEFEDQRICGIPQGEEREILDELFDQLFYDLKKSGFFHERTEASEKILAPGIQVELDSQEAKDNSTVRFYLTGDGQLMFKL